MEFSSYTSLQKLKSLKINLAVYRNTIIYYSHFQSLCKVALMLFKNENERWTRKLVHDVAAWTPYLVALDGKSSEPSLSVKLEILALTTWWPRCFTDLAIGGTSNSLLTP